GRRLGENGGVAVGAARSESAAHQQDCGWLQAGQTHAFGQSREGRAAETTERGLLRVAVVAAAEDGDEIALGQTVRGGFDRLDVVGRVLALESGDEAIADAFVAEDE